MRTLLARHPQLDVKVLRTSWDDQTEVCGAVCRSCSSPAIRWPTVDSAHALAMQALLPAYPGP